MQKPWSFYIHTLGCKVNQYESQALREAWCSLGGTHLDTFEEADVVLINSCAITARGERDTRHAIYTAQRECPQALCILTGCAAQAVAAQITDANLQNAVSVIIPPRAKACLLRGPWQWQDFSGTCYIEMGIFPPFGENGFSISSFQRSRPVIKVHDGCSHRCTYCIVPLVRGRGISRPAHEIVHEAHTLLHAGYVEIMLSGINLHQYGRDFLKNSEEAQDFWALLEILDKALAPEWAGRARFRISSLEPNQLHARGLDIFAQSRMLCPHIHISLQNGSPHILKRMGRGHNRPDAVLAAVQALRKNTPLLSVGADILMGFPGENESHVQETQALIRALHLNYAHVFPYSSRPGTAAAAFPQQVPHALKQERATRIRTLIDEQKQHYLNELVKQAHLNVVFDSPAQHAEAEQYKGIDAHYAPCFLQVPLPKYTGDMGKIVPVRPIAVDKGHIRCVLLTP